MIEFTIVTIVKTIINIAMAIVIIITPLNPHFDHQIYIEHLF